MERDAAMPLLRRGFAMIDDNRQPSQGFEQRLREAAANVEVEVRRLITYVNDEVVPDVRKNSSQALRAAAAELDRLAKRMDEANRAGSTAPPPPPSAKP
jgi:hypothetical protein